MRYRKTKRWHYFEFTSSEARELWLPVEDRQHLRRRRYLEWIPMEPSDSSPMLNSEMYVWLRDHVGHTWGERWSCDRWFYPGEILPELPRDLSYSSFIQRFERYSPDDFSWILEADHIDLFRGRTIDERRDLGAAIGIRSEEHAVAFKLRFG